MDFIKWFIPKQQTTQTDLAFNNILSTLSPSTKQIREDKSPQLTKLITNDTQITYNYYNTYATKVQPAYTGYIHYSLPGKENEPNITMIRRNESINFVSKDLFIFSKIHNFQDMPSFDGELVVKHTPITNGDKPLYVCFPLKTDISAPKNILYNLLSEEDDTKNIDIDLNRILSLEDFAYYYETDYSIIIVTQTPILVPVNFIGFNRGKIDDLWSPPPDNTSIVRISTGTVFIKHTGTGAPAPFGISTPSPKRIVEGMTNTSIEMCDGSYCYFDCDYSTVEFQNEVPTYMIKAGSDNVSYQEKALNYSVTVVWLIVVMILTAFLGPLLFSIIATRKVKESLDDIDNINILDRIEGGLGQLLLIPGIVLISVGAPMNIKCPKDDNECLKAANALITPGAILLSLWFFYSVSLFLNKLLNPEFLGYRNPIGKVNPYFTYTKDYIHFTQHFYPYSLIMFILYVLGYE